MSAVTSLDKLQTLERCMRNLPAESRLEIEPGHLFAPGVYVRVLHMPAGSVIVSKLHKTEHLCIALTGRATVVIDGVTEEVVAPCVMRTLPGTKRALYIHEDSVWMTIHPSEKTDVAEIERDLIAQDYDELEHKGEAP